MTDIAALVVAAYDRGRGDPDLTAGILGDMVVLAASAAKMHAAATYPDQIPFEVVGQVQRIDGNAVWYFERGNKKENRKVHVGNDAISQHAGRVAEAHIGQMCRIFIGYERGKGSDADNNPVQGADIRRLVRCVPLETPKAAPAGRVVTQRRDDGATEYRVPTAEPAAAYTEEEQRPFEPPSSNVRSASPDPYPDQRPSASGHGVPGEASADDDGPCPDLPEEIWQAQKLGLDQADDDECAQDGWDAIKKALAPRVLPAAKQRQLGPWAAGRGISYTRPNTWADYKLVVDAIAAAWCERELP